jgi:hypothetical protein
MTSCAANAEDHLSIPLGPHGDKRPSASADSLDHYGKAHLIALGLSPYLAAQLLGPHLTLTSEEIDDKLPLLSLWKRGHRLASGSQA